MIDLVNPSKWRVREHFVGATPWYGVYRLTDISRDDENGNREYKPGYFQTRKEAEIYAEYLNKEESDK